MRQRTTLISFLFLLVLTPFAALHADATYTYVGKSLGPTPPNPYSPYTPADSVHGFFTLSSALGPSVPNMTDITGLVTAFSFSDGVQSYTQASSLGIEDFKVATDGSGAIEAWQVAIGADDHHFILSCNGDLSGSDLCSPGNGWGLGGAADEVFFSPAVAIHEGTAGTWAQTPEPSALLLLGSGLFGIGARIRRRGTAKSRNPARCR